jgi:predicted O-methyltransferase YrrM
MTKNVNCPFVTDVMLLLVSITRPRLVVELGTGDGFTASRLMEVLPVNSSLATVNWPKPISGDDPLRYLIRWYNDPRLSVIFGDTREEFRRFEDGSIDLLCIDSTHTCSCALTEWNLYRPKMSKSSLVVVDDLDHNDMIDFWELVACRFKIILDNGKVGVFKYDA